MFEGNYHLWNEKRIKGIIDTYGYQFFYKKKVLDLGCGYADMSGVLYRLGAEVTASDARQEHLKIVAKKFPDIKVIQADLDGQWPFFNQRYDLILDLGVLCHLASYEKHLKAVCASTNHLVLETAVCDSIDTNKCLQILESKATYDLSYGGVGCRPSIAAIERVLTECGMTFKRITNSKFNAGEYRYDWIPQNNDGASLDKRALWFVTKDAARQQIPHIMEVSPTQSMGFVSSIKNSGVPVMMTTASPRVPFVNRQITTPIIRGSTVIYSPPFTPQINSSSNEQIRINSRNYSVIIPEVYLTNVRSELSGIITPLSFSCKMWYKKIHSIFPNILLSDKTPSMSGFNKTTNQPNLIMCSINNLQTNSRLWIDEWKSPQLTSGHIEKLKHCSIIITPSLINAQEIWTYLPNANILRMEKPWPLFSPTLFEGGYYVYFEKYPELTKILFNSWDNSFGKLKVIGSSIPIPPFAEFISEHTSYEKIIEIISGAKAMIDLSENNYYNSGLLKLARAIRLPIITNNYFQSDSITTFIIQDKTITSTNIRHAISKFHATSSPNKSYNEDYKNILFEDVRKIMGV